MDTCCKEISVDDSIKYKGNISVKDVCIKSKKSAIGKKTYIFAMGVKIKKVSACKMLQCTAAQLHLDLIRLFSLLLFQLSIAEGNSKRSKVITL